MSTENLKKCKELVKILTLNEWHELEKYYKKQNNMNPIFRGDIVKFTGKYYNEIVGVVTKTSPTKAIVRNRFGNYGVLISKLTKVE